MEYKSLHLLQLLLLLLLHHSSSHIVGLVHCYIQMNNTSVAFSITTKKQQCVSDRRCYQGGNGLALKAQCSSSSTHRKPKYSNIIFSTHAVDRCSKVTEMLGASRTKSSVVPVYCIIVYIMRRFVLALLLASASAFHRLPNRLSMTINSAPAGSCLSFFRLVHSYLASFAPFDLLLYVHCASRCQKSES
jgi:hypothetical protein